jgi:FkbM family methyltransferase
MIKRGTIKQSVGRAIASSMNVFPLKTRVAVKEHITPVEILDYKKATIKMSVVAQSQVKRLHACMKEPETLQWIEENMRTTDVFWDVGANVGAYSLIAYHVSKCQGKIYAFEPMYSTYSELCTNVLLNGCQENVHPFPLALSNVRKADKINFSNAQPGTALHVIGKAGEGGAASSTKQMLSMSILTISIDDCISQFGFDPPDLVKIDVDGLEFQVIQGMEKVLRGSKLRSFIMEVDFANAGKQKNPILDLLKGCGWEVVSKYKRGKSTTVTEVYNCVFGRK